MDYISHSEEETIEIARKICADFKAGDIVAFYGDLGAGKSVFCRSIIRTLLNEPDLNVPSPTFSLVQTYEAKDFDIWHFDFYRLENIEEIYELGWEEALSGNLTLIEWPERIEPALPQDIIKITIEDQGEAEREIKVLS